MQEIVDFVCDEILVIKYCILLIDYDVFYVGIEDGVLCDLKLSDLVQIQYIFGMMGFLKGVLLYYYGLVCNGVDIMYCVGVNLGDVFVYNMLFFYMIGCVILVFGGFGMCGMMLLVFMFDLEMIVCVIE